MGIGMRIYAMPSPATIASVVVTGECMYPKQSRIAKDIVWLRIYYILRDLASCSKRKIPTV